MKNQHILRFMVIALLFGNLQYVSALVPTSTFLQPVEPFSPTTVPTNAPTLIYTLPTYQTRGCLPPKDPTNSASFITLPSPATYNPKSVTALVLSPQLNTMVAYYRPVIKIEGPTGAVVYSSKGVTYFKTQSSNCSLDISIPKAVTSSWKDGAYKATLTFEKTTDSNYSGWPEMLGPKTVTFNVKSPQYNYYPAPTTAVSDYEDADQGNADNNDPETLYTIPNNRTTISVRDSSSDDETGNEADVSGTPLGEDDGPPTGTTTSNTGSQSMSYLSGGSGSPSGSQSSPTNEDTPVSASAGSSENGTTALLPSPDIISCKREKASLYFANAEPSHDNFVVHCGLNKKATMDVAIYTKDYDPKAEDNSANLVRRISSNFPFALVNNKPKMLTYAWNGLDDYDQIVELGEYNFVVAARMNSRYAQDISIQKITVENLPVAGDATGSDEQVATSDSAAAGTADNLHGAAEEGQEPGLLDQLGQAIFGEATDDKQDLPASSAPVDAKSVTREPSKCPNSFYPTDIAGGPFEAIIKKAYDECLVGGYADGTFRADQGLTRAEAAKIVILASGNIAKQGCFDNDCGSPFADLEMWQGPWIRAAWDLGIVKGIAPSVFAPNRLITRAEAAALSVRAFGITPFYGCYDADCGAGIPDDPFNDVTQMWQGPYLRALWDRGILQTVDHAGHFYPDIAVTRGQYIEWIYRVKSLQ